GDGDTAVIEEFRSVLEVNMGSYDEERVIAHPITSVADILAELDTSDVVVATRFHNVLMAMLLNKPVIAISFHHKVSSLMTQVGVSEYCHDIHQMDPDRLIVEFQRLEGNEVAAKRTIARAAAEARAALDEQYDSLFGSPPHGPASHGTPEQDRS